MAPTARRTTTSKARRSGPAANLPAPKRKAEPGTTKSTRNAGRMWSEHDLRELRALAEQNTPTRVIGLKLGRTETSVRSQATRQGLSLKPTNRSPRTTKR